MNVAFLPLLILIALFGLPAPTGSADPIVIRSDRMIAPEFNRDVTYFFDEARRFESDPSGLLEQTFIPGTRSERIELGFSSGLLWGRFQLVQNFKHPQTLVLVFHHANFTRLRLFEVNSGQLKEVGRLGGGIPPEDRSTKAFGSSLPIPSIGPGQHEYVMMAESNGDRLGFGFEIATGATWVDEVMFPQYFGKGLYYGMVVSLLLFHLFVFINNRDRTYALYIGYILSVLLLFLNMDGLLDILLPWPEQGGWRTVASGFAGVILIFVMLVNKIYFDSKKRFPRIDTLFSIALLGGILSLVATPMLPIAAANRLLEGASAFGIIIIFASSAYVWNKGYHPAKYLFIGRLIFTSFVTIYILHLYNFFPNNFLVDYSLQTGSLCDMLIMSYGLGARMRLLEMEKAEAREGERQASFKLNWFNTLVRVITHDLSTPVSVITAATDMELRRAQPSKGLLKNLERIARAAKQQSNLINHVRDMIAVASGKKELELKPVCLNAALEEAINTLAELAEKKQIQLELDRPDYEIHVAADATALVNSVLDNFISNAIKFSAKGAVVRLILQEHVGKALIKIVDNGIGIPNDLQKHLFDPAHATSRPGTDREAGTGFGLPLAQAYIEQFHGKILIESRTEAEGDKPRGTCFIIELPLLSVKTHVAA